MLWTLKCYVNFGSSLDSPACFKGVCGSKGYGIVESGEEKAQENLINEYEYWIAGHKEVRARFFSVMPAQL